jgi:hypothetical protein
LKILKIQELLETLSGILKEMQNKLGKRHNRLVPKFHRNLKVKVKQFRYRLGVAQRVPGS